MPSPLVSVVIPSFNRLQFTVRAIESVLDQTFCDYEVIVVDNGSTDDSATYIARHYGTSIRLVRLHTNQGRSIPRNVGVQEARGPFIAFLDSDDLWLPNKLELQLPVLERDPNVGLVHSFSEVISDAGNRMRRETGRRLRLHRDAIRRGYTYEQMSFRCVLFTSTILVRKKILEAVGGYDTNMPILEDWDLYLRLSLVAEICAVEEVLVSYRQHDAHTTSIEHALGRIHTCHKHLRMLRHHPDLPFAEIARRNLFLNLAAAHYVRGKTAECGRWMKTAIQLDPRVALWPGFLMCTVAAIAPSRLVDEMRQVKRAIVGQDLRSE